MRVEERHGIRPEDQFRMEPGFSNIEPIEAGQLLARDRSGEIRAREKGILFMPLYQGLGDDGFFTGRALAIDNE
jgi:succinylglutamate desuccinylase